MEQFIFLPCFHHKNQIGPFKNIHIYLASTMCAHIDSMLQRNLLCKFIGRMINESAKTSAFYIKIRTKSLF